MQLKLILLFLLLLNQAQAQDSARKNYLAELKVTGRSFTNEFYAGYAQIHSLPEKEFIAKIDSARDQFNAVLNKYRHSFSAAYILQQQTEIKYYFDKLLVEYPLNHDTYIGKTSATPSNIPQRLKGNLADFNKPELLTNADFTNYVRAFLAYQINNELKKQAYKNEDNKQLKATWKLIPRFITDAACKAYWQCDYLYNHIDNNGIKNIEAIYHDFRKTCRDTAYLGKVHAIYAEDSAGRQGHLIKTYKAVGPFKLDMHMFLPDSMMQGTKRPVIIYFHGGSWSEGKPDWFFYACESYAKKGWVACAVEYRTYGRHGTLPFDAVMDARSAIRWLRQHAAEYNIDTARIVASGNSAGGHLILCAALADTWNEKTDDLQWNPAPNILLVNAGVYDLTDSKTAWIRKNLENKDLVKGISPVFLTGKTLPPTLIIHGTNDQHVPWATAQAFVTAMTAAGNKTIEVQSLKGAGHFIWYDPKYSPEVSKLRTEFLVKWGY